MMDRPFVRKMARLPADRRSAPRHEVTITDATLRPHGAAAEPAMLHDLSAYGCRLAHAGERSPGERLWLRLAGGMPIAATVIWCEGEVVGCRFDEAIDRAVMRSLILPVAQVA